MWKGGLGYDKKRGGVYVLSKDEYAQKLADFQKVATSEGNSQRFSELKRRHDMLRSSLKAADDFGTAEEAKQIWQQIKENEAEMAQLMAAGSGEGGEPRPYTPPATPAKALPLEAKKYVDEFTKMLAPLAQERPKAIGNQSSLVPWQGDGQGPGIAIAKESVDKIVLYMVEHQDEFHEMAEGVTKDGRRNMKVGATPSDTVRLYLMELMDSGSAWRRPFIQNLVENGVISQEDAQKLLNR